MLSFSLPVVKITKFEISELDWSQNSDQIQYFLAGPGDTVNIFLDDSIKIKDQIAFSNQFFQLQHELTGQLVIDDSLAHPVSPWKPFQYLAHHLSSDQYVDTLAFYQERLLSYLDQLKEKLTPEIYKYLYHHVIYEVALEKMSFARELEKDNNDYFAETVMNNPDAEGVDAYHDFMQRMTLFRLREINPDQGSIKPTDLYLFARLLLTGYSLYVEAARLIGSGRRGATYQVENIYQEIKQSSNDSLFINTLEKYYNQIVQFGAIGKGVKIPSLQYILDSADLDFNDQPYVLTIWQLQNSQYELDQLKISQDKLLGLTFNSFEYLAEDTSSVADYNLLFIAVGNNEEVWKNQIDSLNLEGRHLLISPGHPLFKNLSSYGNYYVLFDRNHRVNSVNSIPYRLSSKKWSQLASVEKDPINFRVLLEIFALLMGGSLLVFGSITIYQSRKSKKQQILYKIRDLEYRALRAQMNPHFLFNSLNSIQHLINGENIDQANQYLNKFAKLMRMVLNNSEEKFVSLQEELDAIRIYCELEQLRFRFHVKFEIDKNIDTINLEIPGMLIQPLVENAVIHAMSIKKEVGQLVIKIYPQEKFLCIEVYDNGPGFSYDYQPGTSQKHGLELLVERIDLLDKKFDLEIHLVVRRQVQAGTLSSLKIKLDG